MSTIDELLDAAKAATKSANDSELAKALGIRPAAVSNYRRGVSLPNAVVCATLAGLTGTPLARVLGIVGEARAISSDEKAVWRKLAATAMALCLAVGLSLPRDVQAMPSSGYSAEHTVYIMRSSGSVSARRSWALAGTVSSFGSALASLLGLLTRTSSPDLRMV